MYQISHGKTGRRYLVQNSRQEWSHKVFFVVASWIKPPNTWRRSFFADTLQKILVYVKPRAEMTGYGRRVGTRIQNPKHWRNPQNPRTYCRRPGEKGSLAIKQSPCLRKRLLQQTSRKSVIPRFYQVWACRQCLKTLTHHKNCVSKQIFLGRLAKGSFLSFCIKMQI